MRLAVGDVVVYASHGAGRVAARGKTVVLGVEQEIVVFELADGLSVTLPMQRAREQLRPLVSEADVRRVQETLREDGALSGDVWVKRLKQGQAKLRGGDPLELAEVVRDSARRERMLQDARNVATWSLVCGSAPRRPPALGGSPIAGSWIPATMRGHGECRLMRLCHGES